MVIEDKIKKYTELGLVYADAVAKVCGEIILNKLANSSMLNNTTIKGGVVMMNISRNLRRATQDLDLDFIRYSLSDDSIKIFVEKLSNVDNIKLTIEKPITELKHQDYKGKQVFIMLNDTNSRKYEFKLDIGVHKNLSLKQEEICFDLNSLDESVTLLANSKEQIFSEKLKSLLKYGTNSTRYKDIFDFYYLIQIDTIDVITLKKMIEGYIFNDSKMWENNFKDVYNRIVDVFDDKDYLNKLNMSDMNWLELDIKKITTTILDFFKSLQ